MSGILGVVLAGCAVERDTGGLVTREEMDAAVADAVKQALAQVAEEYASTDEVDAAVASALVAADCAAKDDVAAIEGRVSFLEDDYSPAGDLLNEADLRQAGDDALLTDLLQEVADRDAADVVITGMFASYPTWVDTQELADTAQVNAEGYADGLFQEAQEEIDALAGDVALSAERVANLELENLNVLHILRDEDGDGSVVWPVSNAAELLAAVADLDNYHIPSDITLTVEIAAGVYELTAPLNFAHPDGGRVYVVGSTGVAADVEIRFTGSDGVQIREGSALGFLAYISLIGDGTNGSGLQVQSSSAATIGPMVISDFGYEGLEVGSGSYLEGQGSWTVDETDLGWLSVKDNGRRGIYIYGGSGARLPYSAVSGNGLHQTGNGFEVSNSSYLDAVFSSSTGNSGMGYYALGGSIGNFIGATSEDNEGAGFTAQVFSGMDVSNADSVGDAHGVVVEDSSYASAAGATIDTAGYGFISGGGLIEANGATVNVATHAFYAQRHGTIDAREATVISVYSDAFRTKGNAFIDASAFKEGVSTIGSTDHDTVDFILGL